MGSGGSKVSNGGRVLGKSAKNVIADVAKKEAPSVASTRPTSEQRSKEAHVCSDDASVAERLRKLGPVEIRHTEMPYRPISEDRFAQTLEARQELEEKSATELEKEGPRKLIPSMTVTALLKSLQEGDSPAEIAKAYNLDPSILPKLQSLTLPERPQVSNDGVGQSIQDAPQQRQPVRRRRREPSKE